MGATLAELLTEERRLAQLSSDVRAAQASLQRRIRMLVVAEHLDKEAELVVSYPAVLPAFPAIQHELLTQMSRRQVDWTRYPELFEACVIDMYETNDSAPSTVAYLLSSL